MSGDTNPLPEPCCGRLLPAGHSCLDGFDEKGRYYACRYEHERQQAGVPKGSRLGPFVDTCEHLHLSVVPSARAWADAWGREQPDAEERAERLEAALVSAGCSAVRWYNGLVCWRTAGGKAGHLQLTRVATHGEVEAMRGRAAELLEVES